MRNGNKIVEVLNMNILQQIIIDIIYEGDWYIDPDEYYLNNETEVADKIILAVIEHLNCKNGKWIQRK